MVVEVEVEVDVVGFMRCPLSCLLPGFGNMVIHSWSPTMGLQIHGFHLSGPFFPHSFSCTPTTCGDMHQRTVIWSSYLSGTVSSRVMVSTH